jgi:uncharacterized protein
MTSPSTVTRPADGRVEEWTQGGPVKTVMESTKIAQLETTSEARVGETGAMGLFGFAVGTTVLAWVFSGWAPLPASFIAAVPALLVFAGIAQFIAGLYAFNRTHAWAGTALCVYGANYALLATYLWMRGGGLLPATPGNDLMLAVDLFCVGYISLALAIGAVRLNAPYALMTLLLIFGYCLAGIEFLGANRVVGDIAGYCMLAASFFAFYAASATVINSAWQREALPLFTARRR